MPTSRPQPHLDLGAAVNWNTIDPCAAHPTSTLADLYDPLTMPANLRKAHTDLNRAVDKLYRSKRLESDDERVAMLLARYQKLVWEWSFLR